MKKRAPTFNRVTRNRFLSAGVLTLTCSIAASQSLKTLKPAIYNDFINPSKIVSIKTFEDGKIKDTASVAINNVRLAADKKQVITYDKRILTINNASYQKIKSALHLTVPAQDIKIIPEIHIEPYPGRSEPCIYRVVFSLEQPFRYDDSLKKFNGRLGFFLVGESGNETPPPEPVNVEITSNEITAIAPEGLKIDHINIPSVKVQLSATQVKDSAAIKVITASNPEGYTTYIKVTPRLVISTNQSILQGLGIEQIPVNLMFEGSGSSDSVTVNFSTQKGAVTPNSVALRYNKPTTIYLRSDGLGSSKLSATSTVADSNELIFTYVFPWLFLLAAIAGGLIGSLAKYLLAVENKGSMLKPLIGGILIGIIGAVAYYGLGVNLLGISLSAGLNALAVFALSALSAYFGISLIKLDKK